MVGRVEARLPREPVVEARGEGRACRSAAGRLRGRSAAPRGPGSRRARVRRRGCRRPPNPPRSERAPRGPSRSAPPRPRTRRPKVRAPANGLASPPPKYRLPTTATERSRNDQVPSDTSTLFFPGEALEHEPHGARSPDHHTEAGARARVRPLGVSGAGRHGQREHDPGGEAGRTVLDHGGGRGLRCGDCRGGADDRRAPEYRRARGSGPRVDGVDRGRNDRGRGRLCRTRCGADPSRATSRGGDHAPASRHRARRAPRPRCVVPLRVVSDRPMGAPPGAGGPRGAL